MAQSLKLFDNNCQLIALVDNIPNSPLSLELQYRHDIAHEYGMENGEGYFFLVEDGQVLNKLEIPIYH